MPRNLGIVKNINKVINPFGFLLSKPEVIHNNGGISGGTTFSRRLFTLDTIYREIESVDGDILEIGVHWGYGLLIHLNCVRFSKRKIFGFDSFQGHSKPNEKDFLGGRFPNFGGSFAISQENVFETLRLGTNYNDEDLKKIITLVPGWLQDTLPVFKDDYLKNNKKVAFVHCDVDIYEPFLVGLTNSWRILNKGGIIVLGRLNNPELMGKTEAYKEFTATIPSSSYELKFIETLDPGTLYSDKLSYLVKTV